MNLSDSARNVEKMSTVRMVFLMELRKMANCCAMNVPMTKNRHHNDILGVTFTLLYCSSRFHI